MYINLLIIHEICIKSVLSLYCENAIEIPINKTKNSIMYFVKQKQQPLAFKPNLGYYFQRE